MLKFVFRLSRACFGFEIRWMDCFSEAPRHPPPLIPGQVANLQICESANPQISSYLIRIIADTNTLFADEVSPDHHDRPLLLSWSIPQHWATAQGWTRIIVGDVSLEDINRQLSNTQILAKPFSN